jgi:hypothetical protein
MSRNLFWLRDSFRAIDRVYFGDAVSIEGFTVKWMPWRPTKSKFVFGLCDKENKVIKLNQALRHEWVPDYVVLATLYHEMLHIVIGDDHDTTFDLAENRFVHYSSAQIWENSNLDALMKAEKPG